MRFWISGWKSECEDKKVAKAKAKAKKKIAKAKAKAEKKAAKGGGGGGGEFSFSFSWSFENLQFMPYEFRQKTGHFLKSMFFFFLSE